MRGSCFFFFFGVSWTRARSGSGKAGIIQSVSTHLVRKDTGQTRGTVGFPNPRTSCDHGINGVCFFIENGQFWLGAVQSKRDLFVRVRHNL